MIFAVYIFLDIQLTLWFLFYICCVIVDSALSLQNMLSLINIFMRITLYSPYAISHAGYDGPRRWKPIDFL